MRRGFARGALLLVIGAALGAGAARLVPTPPPGPVCRPSDPVAAAAAQAPGVPVLLLLGNSQVFDGDWRFGPDMLVVNCARQGMTAAEGLAVLPALPRLDPDLVLVGFGAVEALRGADPAGFAQTYGALLDALGARWGEARLLAMSVPPMRAAGPQGPGVAPQAAAAAPRFSAAIRGEADRRGAAFLDAGAALGLGARAGAGPPPALSHDGVHLSAAGYAALSAAWQAALVPQTP